MDAVFLRVLNMSVTACYIILFVIAIRLLLRKAPRIFSYILWAAVLFRLVFPFSFESVFSLLPVNAQPVPENIMYAGTPRIQSGIAAVDQAVNRSLPAPDVGVSMNPIQLWIFLGEILWLAGVAVLLTYSIITTVKLYRKLQYARHTERNIYELPGIATPFVFGVLKPKIYLPADISEKERNYILRHEQTHIKRFDHIIKLFAFLVLCVHWFNPLVWIAFFLMSTDMELSCDESVLKQLGGDIKKEYSASLLSLSAGKRTIGGCPLAFGEGNIKGRIKNILSYKKPAFWVVIIAVLIVAAACVGLISDPQGSGLQDGNPQGGDLQENGVQGETLTVEDYAEQFVRDQLAVYETAKRADFKIIDTQITKLERLDRFENMFDYPVELWHIEYRWKPDDIHNAALSMGNVNIEWIIADKEGWILEDSSKGFSALVFSYERPEPRYLGRIFTNDGVNGNGDTVAGRETLLRVHFEEQGLLPHETYKGEHIVVKFPLSTGETCQLLLSQPVTEGDSGIWCVERWMDGNGTVYYDTPQYDLTDYAPGETDGTALDYYRVLQEQCESGQNTWRLDPLEVSMDYINNGLGQNVSLAELEPRYNAGAADFEETPVSYYIGFIVSEFDHDKPGYFSFNLDPIEWLTLNDAERLKEIKVDPDSLPNGFYIHNPNTYSQHFQGTDETRFRIIDPAEGVSHKDVTMGEFTDYLKGFTDFVPPFRVVTKGGYVQSIEEQYVP
ncbi:MAG TPA: M56 family metallopeptidase [Anaerovoracaceae bacterium]|nr:M56 family metallopeptidase [Anaerovoracaceae bacterium]